MTVFQILIFIGCLFCIYCGYKAGYQDGFKEGRYVSRIGSKK